MRVSVVIATRDRPALLGRALASVQAQTFPELEIIVVDDGSAPSFAAEHDTLARSLGERGAFHRLPPVPGGHGPSFARNHGVAQAQGEWIAFLDDDDEWIDPDYLARAVRTLTATPSADLQYANQEAVRADGSRVEHVVWIEDLAAILERSGPKRPDGTFLAHPAQLLQSRGFCHLNATLVRRALFQQIGGFDVSLRYEEDRDFHLRAIDAASAIVHDPAIVARHHVPERGTQSTRMSPDQRTLDQLRLLDKAILQAKRPQVRAYAQLHKAYTLKALAQRRAGSGHLAIAAFYASEALGIGANPRWLAYLASLWLKRGLRPWRTAISLTSRDNLSLSNGFGRIASRSCKMRPCNEVIRPVMKMIDSSGRSRRSSSARSAPLGPGPRSTSVTISGASSPLRTICSAPRASAASTTS